MQTATSEQSAQPQATQRPLQLCWKPDIAGTYPVYVTFAGSKAYYGSSGQTAFNSGSVGGGTGSPTPTPTTGAGLTADQRNFTSYYCNHRRYPHRWCSASVNDA